MRADASAFAALGLEPGADAAAIDQAYKRLIKLHHPDREGGDVARAAEINRAYRELRGGAGRDPLEFNEDLPLHQQGLRWVTAAVFVAIAVAVLALIAPITRVVAPAAVAHLPLAHVVAAAAPSDPMDQPLHLSMI